MGHRQEMSGVMSEESKISDGRSLRPPGTDNAGLVRVIDVDGNDFGTFIIFPGNENEWSTLFLIHDQMTCSSAKGFESSRWGLGRSHPAKGQVAD